MDGGGYDAGVVQRQTWYGVVLLALPSSLTLFYAAMWRSAWSSVCNAGCDLSWSIMVRKLTESITTCQHTEVGVLTRHCVISYMRNEGIYL